MCLLLTTFKAFVTKTPLNELKSAVFSLGGCLFSGTADLNGSSESSDQVDSAGKEADLASLNWENGAPFTVNTRTFSYLQLG